MTVVQFSLQTTVGRAGLFSIAAAVAVGLIALAAPRTAATAVAAGGSRGRRIWPPGHSRATYRKARAAASAVAVHALAAALWCGALAALVLTVEHRGQWARVLPRFSQLSLVCVAVLLAAGTAGAVAAVDSWDAICTRPDTVACCRRRSCVTAALMALAWRNRAGWLPAARAHRATAGLSRTRSLTELAMMAVALAAAAALAVTG